MKRGAADLGHGSTDEGSRTERGPTGRCTEPTPGLCSGSNCSVQGYACTMSGSSPGDEGEGVLRFSNSYNIIDSLYSFIGSTFS